MNAALPTVVLASGNSDKMREFSALLSSINIRLLAQTACNVPAARETGLSYIENALIKARNAARHTGLAVLADDSGLEVDVLGGEPGIYSARYAGAAATDEENLQLLLNNLLAKGDEPATACFHCAIVYLRSEKDTMPLIAQASWHGQITMQPRGEHGFGYDPVFYLPAEGCTAAELPAPQKNRVSHRARALQQLLTSLPDVAAMAG